VAAEYAAKVRVIDERVDPAEIGDILTAACVARNGWKVIFGRCALVRTRRRIVGP
jgi:hypothetical protein